MTLNNKLILDVNACDKTDTYDYKSTVIGNAEHWVLVFNLYNRLCHKSVNSTTHQLLYE